MSRIIGIQIRWTLEVYPRLCLAREPSRRSAPKVEHGSTGPPGVVLIGLSSSGHSRSACVRALKALAPRLPVLILSARCDAASVGQCCLAGADGCLLKPVAPGDLGRAVSSVTQGQPVLCHEAEQAIMNFLHAAGTVALPHALTPREQELVGCLAAKLCDKDIAVHLGIETNTVHVHKVHLFRKLGVHNVGQALRKLLGGEK